MKNWFKNYLLWFTICYFSLYIFIFPLLLNRFEIVPWVGKTFFGLVDLVEVHSGSGDTTFNYVRLFVILILSITLPIILSFIPFKEKQQKWIYQANFLIVRYYLALVMLGYGKSKLFASQFSEFSLYNLEQNYGESSPMGLAWNFMGFSTSYQMFTGFLELIVAFFLLFNRTTLFASLVGIGVMSNIFMLNMCFDIPVKLGSGNYLLMCIFLASKDFRRIINFFILNRLVPKVEIKPIFDNKYFIYFSYIIKSILIICFIFTLIPRKNKEIPINQSFHGNYFLKSNLSSEIINPLNIEKIYIDTSRKYLVLSTIKGKKSYAKYEIKGGNLEIFSERSDLITKDSILKYQQVTKNLHRFDGKLNGKETTLFFSRKTEKDYLLTGRGFHWINEEPFNR